MLMVTVPVSIFKRPSYVLISTQPILSSFRYHLEGTGSDLFTVDPITGKISVSACPAPTSDGSCLDYETTRAYFLSYSATDNNGEGRR